MEIIKDFLTLFLQLTALQVLLVASWPIRKPKLRLATAIIVLNIDLALRSEAFRGFNDCKCLSDFLNRITRKTDSDDDRIIFGYRDPIRGLDVIKELSEWESAQYSHGPVLSISDDDERRWESILRFRKYECGIDIGDEHHFELPPKFREGPLGRLREVIKRKYGYKLGRNFDSGEEPAQFLYLYCEHEKDFLAMILADIEKECPSDMERAIAISRLCRAMKVINIVQLKNPYHSSINNIHLLISNEYRGEIKLVTEFNEKQGFSVSNNSTQNVHLVLSELPPNSERYCILETRLQPLAEKDIRMQSNLLLDKLSPQVMRPIIISAAILTALVVLLNQYIDAEVINSLELFFQTLLSTKA